MRHSCHLLSYLGSKYRETCTLWDNTCCCDGSKSIILGLAWIYSYGLVYHGMYLNTQEEYYNHMESIGPCKSYGLVLHNILLKSSTLLKPEPSLLLGGSCQGS